MLENPIISNHYTGPKDYKIREEYPEKFLGDP